MGLFLEFRVEKSMSDGQCGDDRTYRVAPKTGPPYLIANILKIP